eukprot:4913608-Prymnesium_polylepis.1
MAELRSKRHRDTSVRRAVPVEAAMEAAALEGLRRRRVVCAASWPEVVSIPDATPPEQRAHETRRAQCTA